MTVIIGLLPMALGAWFAATSAGALGLTIFAGGMIAGIVFWLGLEASQ